MILVAMDIMAMLEQLRAERERLDEAILVIQRLAAGGAKRRGRPPKWMSTPKAAEHAEPGKKQRQFSAATRKRMAAAQKRRWAEKRAQALALRVPS